MEPPPPEKQRGLKGKVVAKKTGEMKEELEAAVALVQQYVPPSPDLMQVVMNAGTASLAQAGPGAASLKFLGYVKKGDALTLTFDSAVKGLRQIEVNTWLDEPESAVTLKVTMQAMPEGISYPGTIVFSRRSDGALRWASGCGWRSRWRIPTGPDRRDRSQPGTGFRHQGAMGAPAGGHLQLSGVVRQLRGEPVDRVNEIVAAGGYGINLSGRLPVRFWSERDQLLFQHNSGKGLGRYISDLGSFGGQDGVYHSTAQTLRPLAVFSGYVGYEHWWSERLRSSASFGIVDVNNLDIQTDDALHLTRRYTINVMWSPIPRLDLVTEFLWGLRRNKDGGQGSAAQTQIGSTFRF